MDTMIVELSPAAMNRIAEERRLHDLNTHSLGPLGDSGPNPAYSTVDLTPCVYSIRGAWSRHPMNYEEALKVLGWRSVRIGQWVEPHRSLRHGTRLSLPHALHMAAKMEAAQALREMGWYAPYQYGLNCPDSHPLCRAPGTWEGPRGRPRRGKWTRPVLLTTALRYANLKVLVDTSGAPEKDQIRKRVYQGYKPDQFVPTISL